MNILSKYQFPGIELMEQSCSQVGQDVFVLTLLKGKTHGRYVEIGAHEPKYINNSYVLEKTYDWQGVSLDNAQWSIDHFKQLRSNPVLLEDATTADYAEIFNDLGWTDKVIDYASVDIEPCIATYQALVKLLNSGYKCAVITFEHANYQDKENSREKSREFLTNLGYDLLVPNIRILPDRFEFEDWWVHPDLVDMVHVEQFRSTSEYIFWKTYLYGVDTQ
jgi:hypothetical protein